MLQYNNTFMRTGVEFSVVKIDNNNGPGWTPEKTHLEVTFNGAIRPTTNMQMIVEMFNNDMQYPLNINSYSFEKVNVLNLELLLEPKMYMTINCKLYAKNVSRGDDIIMNPPSEYFEDHPLAISYNSLLTYGDNVIKAYHLKLHLTPNRLMELTTPSDYNKVSGIYILKFHDPSGVNKTGELHINCIYSHDIWKPIEFSQMKTSLWTIKSIEYVYSE